MAVEAVVFDLGETLVDEGRGWTAWAEWLGVRPFDLFAALGAVIERRPDHPVAVESMLEELHGLADVVGSSGRWGVEKPSPAFFERVVAEVGLDPSAIAYVGDRLD